jgi:hypothetical protein
MMEILNIAIVVVGVVLLGVLTKYYDKQEEEENDD